MLVICTDPETIESRKSNRDTGRRMRSNTWVHGGCGVGVVATRVAIYEAARALLHHSVCHRYFSRYEELKSSR